MNNHEAILERASTLAFQKLDAAGGNFASLGEPHRTVTLVFSAQGVIDNGGLMYFFESDWPGQPPYSLFADAYRRIGCAAAAEAITQAANSFGMPNPEQNQPARSAFMAHCCDPESPDYIPWDDSICGDEQVWMNLARWLQKQA